MSKFFEFYAVLVATVEQARKEDRGAAMVEYALLIAGVALFMGAVVALVGTKISDFITNITF